MVQTQVDASTTLIMLDLKLNVEQVYPPNDYMENCEKT